MAQVGNVEYLKLIKINCLRLNRTFNMKNGDNTVLTIDSMNQVAVADMHVCFR